MLRTQASDEEADDVLSRRPLYCRHAGSDVMGCLRPTGGVFTYVSSDTSHAEGVPRSDPQGTQCLVPQSGDVCNPRSLKEGTETSRRRTDELGYRLERPIHFECKLKEPMHIGMRLLHPAAADHSVSINRQQVQRIFRFSLRSRVGARPLSGGTGAVATGCDVSVPSFRERGLHT